MANYVKIDSAAFEAFLHDKGFVRTVQTNEVVYVKPFAGKEHVVVKIYTSICDGNDAARDVGRDAIRTIAVFDDGKKSFGIFKGSRVYRTTSQDSVHERTLDRITLAFDRCDKWAKEQETKHALVQAASNHIGEVGQELALTLKVVKRLGPYSNRYLFKMADKTNNVFVFWTDKNVIQEGETYDTHAIIKSHSTYNNIKQTELTGCRGKRVVL